MIIVKSLNTHITTFTTLQDLALNFKPVWGNLQNYTYVDTVKNEYVSFYKIAKEIRNVTNQTNSNRELATGGK